jgi:hypothetical protein
VGVGVEIYVAGCCCHVGFDQGAQEFVLCFCTAFQYRESITTEGQEISIKNRWLLKVVLDIGVP